MSHTAVSRLLTSTEAWFGFNETDVWTLFHSYAFDFSVWELWGALLYGGRLVVVPYLTSRSPEGLHNLLVEQAVTVLNQTPSAFRRLVWAAGLSEGAGLALRLVIFGGEALELEGLRPWFERHGDRRPRLVNMYGITETTVHVTHRPLAWCDLQPAAGSPIGIPIPDLELYVLDPCGLPAPVGIPGELYVGGPGLSRGYLGRPDLTAERFLPHPFSARSGERLYRTGDLGRLRANGDLEYLRRIDHQVKIRGFRIELGEIESALTAHPEVREAAVILEETAGEPRLVAYVVPGGEEPPSPGRLRAFLQEKLPDYMVPAFFVPIPALPLTAHGKVDRRALPSAGLARPDLDTVYAAPLQPLEQLLAAVWAQVLGIERIGIDDNFFAMGGDSMRTLQVLAAARERGLEMDLQQIYRRQTVRELAEELGRALGLGENGTETVLGEEEELTRLLEELEELSPDQAQAELLDRGQRLDARGME